MLSSLHVVCNYFTVFWELPGNVLISQCLTSFSSTPETYEDNRLLSSLWWYMTLTQINTQVLVISVLSGRQKKRKDLLSDLNLVRV